MNGAEPGGRDICSPPSLDRCGAQSNAERAGAERGIDEALPQGGTGGAGVGSSVGVGGLNRVDVTTEDSSGGSGARDVPSMPRPTGRSMGVSHSRGRREVTAVSDRGLLGLIGGSIGREGSEETGRKVDAGTDVCVGAGAPNGAGVGESGQGHVDDDRGETGEDGRATAMGAARVTKVCCVNPRDRVAGVVGLDFGVFLSIARDLKHGSRSRHSSRPWIVLPSILSGSSCLGDVKIARGGEGILSLFAFREPSGPDEVGPTFPFLGGFRFSSSYPINTCLFFDGKEVEKFISTTFGANVASLLSSTGTAAPLQDEQHDRQNEKEGQEREEDVVDCSICMCQVTGEKDAASLDECRHYFHFHCIVKVSEDSNQQSHARTGYICLLYFLFLSSLSLFIHFPSPPPSPRCF